MSLVEVEKIPRRRPRNRNGRFTWHRIACERQHTVQYRLFRRSVEKVWHTEGVCARAGEQRADVARRLRIARKRLLDFVDDLDLRALGLIA